jgi:pyruvoyl-dependent arginine decarboxylase (PvlArgDC)
MNTFTAATEETPTTQATEKIYINGMPVTYTPLDGSPQQATYDEPFGSYGNRHNITLLADGASLIVDGSRITPNRSLTDEEMTAYLTEQMFEMGATIDRLYKTITALESDADKISTALAEEADDRGWCGEYNDFCERVNSTLERIALQPLEQEYEVEVEVKAEISTRYTLMVTASSLENAQSMVEDDPEMFFDPTSVASDAVQNDGWDDYEVSLAY